MSDAPWGHKVTLSIYLEGRPPTADEIATAAQKACDTFEVYGCTLDFAGAALEPVQDQPYDQGAR